MEKGCVGGVFLMKPGQISAPLAGGKIILGIDHRKASPFVYF
jgi:hypothetical protein